SDHCGVRLRHVRRLRDPGPALGDRGHPALVRHRPPGPGPPRPGPLRRRPAGDVPPPRRRPAPALRLLGHRRAHRRWLHLGARLPRRPAGHRGRKRGLSASVLGDAPLVAFVATTDLGRARTFYAETLGLTFTDEN